MPRKRWAVRLGGEADRDFVSILAWTIETFGRRQAGIYRTTIQLAIRALERGPAILGARAREEIGGGIRTLHISRGGRSGRHFIMFRESEPDIVEVMRILHDSMDLARHMPPDDAAE